MDFIETQKYIDELRSAGYTWQEVCDACNIKYGKEYGEAKWRKPYQAWRQTVDDVLQDENNELIEREIERLARAKVRLEVNRKVLNAQKSIINEEVSKEAKYELFNEAVLTALENTSPIIEELPQEKKEDDEIVNYVFGHSDTHYDGNQDLNIHFSELLSMVKDKKSEYNFKEIIWIEGGDACEGATLRQSQLMAIKDGLVSQSIAYSTYLSKFINILTKKLDINVKVLIVETSNHTELRSLGTGRSELPLEDLMRTIVHELKISTKNNKRVEVISAPKIIETINGIDYYVSHGHEVTNKKNELKDMMFYTGKNIQYGYIAHFHNYETIPLVFYKNTMQYKSMTVLPHSKVNDGDYEEKLKVSSAPAILFSVDKPSGQKQELLIMKKSLERDMIEKEKEKQKKLKIMIR